MFTRPNPLAGRLDTPRHRLSPAILVTLVVTIALAPMGIAEAPENHGECIASAKVLLRDGINEEAAEALQQLAASERCQQSSAFSERFTLFADVVEALATEDGVGLAGYAATPASTSPVDDVLEFVASTCPSTPQLGEVGISVTVDGAPLPFNEMVGAGTAKHTGGVLAFNQVSFVDLTVAGTQLYGLKGEQGAVSSKGTIQIVGVPIPAAHFTAGVTCGYVDENPVKDLVKQACTAMATATLIDWSVIPGATDPVQITVWGSSESVPPCDG